MPWIGPTLGILLAVTGCGPGRIAIDETDPDPDGDTAPDVDPDTDPDTEPLPDNDWVTAATITPHAEVRTMLVVTWSQKSDADEAWLSWTLDGEAFTTPARARAAGEQREIVLGLPERTEVDVALHVVSGGIEHTVALGDGRTGELPSDLMEPTLTLSDPTRMRPERWLLTSVNVGPQNFFGPCYVVILDAEGRVVWYRAVSDSRLTMFPKVSRRGGYLLWDASTYYVFDDVDPSVIRATLDLETEEETVTLGLGLAYDELDDGSLLFDEAVSEYQYYLTRQHPDGDRERIWDCNAWMSDWTNEYWACAANTVLWSPERGTVLWSMFQTSTVVELDLATGELLREFGEFPGGYGFDPPTSRLDLQHYPNWTPDGTLIVSTHVPREYGVQMAREFAIDDAEQTLTEVWSYTPEAGHYAEYAGQVMRLPSGNVLWQFGTDGVVQEATAEGDVVWEIDWTNHMTGNVTPIADLYALTTG